MRAHQPRPFTPKQCRKLRRLGEIERRGARERVRARAALARMSTAISDMDARLRNLLMSGD